MAVGWWAKSSMRVMPSIWARTSRRRLTLLKVARAVGDGFCRDALAGGEGRGGGGVQGVVLAGEVHGEFGPRDAVAIHFPARLAVFVTQIADAPVGGVGKAVALDAAEGAADAFGHVRAAVVGDDEAAARNQIDEALEGGLHGFEVGVDVGVVEFDVGEDERVRKVVEELGAFVEEGGVVLVALDDEGARGAELKAGAEVFRDAADEERGLERGIFARGNLVDPGQHAGGGGFAVGSGDDEGFAACEKLLAQQRGHGGEGNALVEDALDFGIAARERVADDDEIGRGIESSIRRRARGRGCRASEADRSWADKRPCRSR